MNPIRYQSRDNTQQVPALSVGTLIGRLIAIATVVFLVVVGGAIGSLRGPQRAGARSEHLRSIRPQTASAQGDNQGNGKAPANGSGRKG